MHNKYQICDKVDIENTIYESWKQTPTQFIKDGTDITEYQNWFDSTLSIKDAASKGFIDFYSRILTPDLFSIIGDPRSLNSLEIGCGGGRLITPAAKIFNKSYGVDILNEECLAITSNFIKNNGVDNFNLLNYNEIDKIENRSISFIYSFIVFQHFSSIKYFYSYMDFIDRILTKNGCCNIFFAINIHDDKDYFFDKSFKDGDRNCTMYYKPEFVINVLQKKYNFEIISAGQTTKHPWSSKEKLSNQFFVKFKR